MSDYMIDLCETLESLTGYDFDAIQRILMTRPLLALWPSKDKLPDTGSKRDMRNLAKWLSVYLA